MLNGYYLLRIKGTVISLFAYRNLILRHPIAVSGETTTCSQVVAERANTVGLFVGAKIKVYKLRSALSPTNWFHGRDMNSVSALRGIYVVPEGICFGGPQ